MFKAIKNFFKSSNGPVSLFVDKNGEPTSEDINIAVAVLLVEIAASDKDIAPEEGSAVVEVLIKELGIPDSEHQSLIETAVAASEHGKKIGEFSKVINASFSPEQRQRVLYMLWRVILADGKIDKFEERMAIQMKSRFQLTDDQAAVAKRMAEMDHRKAHPDK